MYRPLLRFGLIVTILAVIGTIGYSWIEGWTAFDALYMTVITLSTVGFGEVHSLSPAGRLFTIVLIVGGVGSLTYLIAALTHSVASGVFTGELRSRKMRHQIDQLSGHSVVCGFGRVGRQVAADLTARGQRCVVIERSAPLSDAKQTPLLWIIGDAADDDILRQAGIERAAGLIAATGDDATNLFITMSAHALNPSIRIVARANAASTDQKLKRAGATHVVSPYVIGGRRMAWQLFAPGVTEFIDTVTNGGGPELWLEELTVGDRSPLIGHTLAEAVPRTPGAANVVAIRRGAHGAFMTNPPAEFCVAPDDVLIALGTRDQLHDLASLATVR